MDAVCIPICRSNLSSGNAIRAQAASPGPARAGSAGPRGNAGEVMIDGQPPACTGDAQPGLRRRMAHGAVWLVALRFSVRGMGMVSTLLTAPLLSPADFALVALAT